MNVFYLQYFNALLQDIRWVDFSEDYSKFQHCAAKAGRLPFDSATIALQGFVMYANESLIESRGLGEIKVVEKYHGLSVQRFLKAE